LLNALFISYGFFIESASSQISTWTEQGYLLVFVEMQSKIHFKKTF